MSGPDHLEPKPFSILSLMNCTINCGMNCNCNDDSASRRKSSAFLKRNTMATLLCAVVGVGGVFPVEIDLSQSVGNLKKKIKEEKKYSFPASRLKLYLAREGDAWLRSRNDELKKFKEKEISEGIKSLMCKELQMMETRNLDAYFGKIFERAKGDIHVLVECPPQPNQSVDLMPPIDEGWTARWLSDFRKSQIPSHNLPLVGELDEFIKHELPVKITLHERIQKSWISKMKTPSYELMDKIFRVANSEPCVEFLNQIGYRVVVSVDPGDSKYSFVSFWDDLIRHVLNFVGIGKSDRDSSRSGSAGPHRPDYMFFVDSVCVLRGMEKDPGEQIDTPRRELVDKLIWSYGDAPYLIGYAAVGYEVRLYAITHACNSVNAVELGVYDLRHLEGRFSLLLAILNVARLLRSLASLCPERARGEFKSIIRDRGVKVLLEPNRVVKCFPTSLYQQANDHAHVVYKVLEEHAIPNVDRLDYADCNAKRLIFKPRGRKVIPANIVELFHALANVLQALVKLHAASWMHRDIRWANVIQNCEDNSWFLIDFMDAAPSPQFTPSGCHLNREEHAPEIFASESHSTAVDIWSVGLLIRTCGSVHANWYDKGGKRSQFENLLLHPDPMQRPTAAAALEQLGQLEMQYLKSSRRTKRQRRQ